MKINTQLFADPAPVIEDDATKVINDLADLKKNMVPRADLEKALAEAAKYKKALLTGAALPDAEPLKTVKELKQEYAESIKNGVTNLKGFETALKLREAVINETGHDPFMQDGTANGGSKIASFDPDFGERVAEGISQVIEKSGGDSQVFNAHLSRTLR